MKHHVSFRKILVFSILSTVLMMSLSTTVPVAHAQPLMTHLKHTPQMSSFVHEEHDHHVKSSRKSLMVQMIVNMFAKKTPSITSSSPESCLQTIDYLSSPSHANTLFKNSVQKPVTFSDDLWGILLQILSAIIELADFLYRAVEPFMVIIFTLLYAVNPPLAILFVVFMLVLRIISLLDIPSEVTAVMLPS